MKKLALILPLSFLSIALLAQKPNFSGIWKLNENKSELNYEFTLAPKALTVEHTRKTLDVTTDSEWDGQPYQIKNHYTLDGEPCENPGFEGTLTKSTAAFDKKAKTIKIVTDGEVQGMGYTLTQVFSMKDDMLVVETGAVSDMGEMAETYVFDKE